RPTHGRFMSSARHGRRRGMRDYATRSVFRSLAVPASRKVIVTCAVPGAIHTPTMSPYLPITPEQIAESAIGAARAGAAIVHLHARDPRDGRPTQDPGLFRQFLPT